MTQINGFKLTFPPETAGKVIEAYGKAERILEYGTGGSTILAAKKPGTKIIACESDKEWLDRLMDAAIGLPGKIYPVHADIGPTREWGHPAPGANPSHFLRYPTLPWEVAKKQAFEPDLVLIDGRFRPMCFLVSMVQTQRPVRIIFDDYEERENYHFVEKYCPRTEYFGRAAVFDVEPGMLTASQFLDHWRLFFDAR
ncbi:MAG: hypothetical protein AAGH41_02315 [Pseudomonadota bacterium]